MPDLVTSKGEFVFKRLSLDGVIVAEEEQGEESRSPTLGIMGIEEKDGDREALEFSLNVYNLPKELDTASFF